MSTQQGSSRINTDGLILYYDPINERCYRAGSTCSNLISDVNSGSLLNGVGYDGLGFVFDGLNDRILIQSTLELSSIQVPMTIMGWFNHSGINSLPTIFAQYQNTSPGFLVKLVRLGSSRLNYFCSSTGGFQQFTLTSASYVTNTWNFFSVVVSGNTTVYSISLRLNETTQNFSGTNMASPVTAVECRIGMPQNTNTSECFNGKISTMMVYNRALSQSEVDYVYTLTKNKFGR